MDIMASIKIRVAEDGTCSICKDGTIISSGLTRSQADQLVAVLRAIEGHA
jgi:ribosomal protein L11 methylase PrmA